MYLNEFADELTPLDMTRFDEFASLQRSAADLGVRHAPRVRYVSRNTALQNHRIHFLEWGDPAAPPLLLIHGGNQSAHSWDLVSLHWADRYHIFAYDQRGHGDSEWARDADYSVPTLTQDALAFIRQLGLERPIIVGHSLGGLVTMTLTLQQPSLPRALVIVDTGPETAQQGAQTVRDFMVANAEFDSLEAFVERVRAYDPFRSREHIERTVRYNLLRRADGKYVANPTGFCTTPASCSACPSASTPSPWRPSRHPLLGTGAARGAVAGLGGGCRRPLRGRAAPGPSGDRAGLRPQRAYAEHARFPGSGGAVPGGALAACADGADRRHDLLL